MSESNKQDDGMPQAMPMPGHPIGALPRAVLMPSAMPDAEGRTMPHAGERMGAAPAAEVSAMPGYPGGRGGMSMVPTTAGEVSATGRPPASEMPAGPILDASHRV